jgi:formylmethanofuran dehydrogenase subunit E
MSREGWAEDPALVDEPAECARCGERSEWRDDETGELLCDGCAR